MTIPDPASVQSGDEDAYASHLSLPKPERTGPRRVIATIGRFDDSAPPDGAENPTPGRPLVSAKDVIEHGIRVAQEVIDQQIGSGERILRHLRRAPIRKRRVSPLDLDASASLTERTLILYRELGVLSLELLETVVETPTVMQMLARWLGLEPQTSGAGSSSSSGRNTTGPAAPRCGVQISSRKFATVELSWLPGAALDEPHVPGLHKEKAAPIGSITFVPEAGVFRVAIADDQPPGVYAGAILSRRTAHALGTMVITIAADKADAVNEDPGAS